MSVRLLEALQQHPVIAAVKSLDDFDDALQSDCTILFLLCGNIFNLGKVVQRAKALNKLIFLHMDLIEGFSRDAVALRYIAQEIQPDGIISTKNSQLKAAKEMGLLTVQRLFIVDSRSIQTTERSSELIQPDLVEILPGIMPRIIRRISSRLEIPVIAGGLVSEAEDVVNAKQNGALGVSASSKDLWNLVL